MNYIPIELQKSLKRGERVLFVGAGLSKGLPNWEELMKPLAEQLDINTDEDPRIVAGYYKIQYGRSKLEEKIISQLGKDVQQTKTHQLLAELPFKAIITTNYDQLLESVLSGRNFVRIINGKEAPLAGVDQLPLVKMHGDLDNPSTMVITKTDYDEYSEKHKALITYLLGFLISYNFLFVGFSLKDSNFDNIYTQIKSLFGKTRKNFVIFKNPSELEIRRLKNIGIEVIPIENYDEIPIIFEELVAICSQKVKGGMELTHQQLGDIQDTFCEIVKRQNKWLDPRGIFQFDRMLTKREIKLEEAYVVPQLIKQEIIQKRKNRDKKEFDEGKIIESVEKMEYILERRIKLSIRDGAAWVLLGLMASILIMKRKKKAYISTEKAKVEEKEVKK